MDFLALNSSIYQRSWNDTGETDTKEHTGFTEIIDILAKNHRILTGVLLNSMLLLFCNSFKKLSFAERNKKSGRFSKEKICASAESSLILNWYFEVFLETNLRQSILQWFAYHSL